MRDASTELLYVGLDDREFTVRVCRLVVSPHGRVESPTTHSFGNEVIQIGSAPDNDLTLTESAVSRHHCRIFREGHHYLIRDLWSTNGTFVNGVRVREAFLQPGDTLGLGEVQVHFVPQEERVAVTPSERSSFGALVGESRAMREVYAILERFAPSDSTVLIEGETGTGKELVARSVHEHSRRKDAPFVVFDCGAVPPNLIESQLFGHVQGAFTGAVASRPGVFELAQGGSIFLDELGELDLELQPKLLRVLEQREVTRVGGTKSIPIDVRVVAATNRRLEEEVEAGRFRRDLYYRLNVLRIELPPLRDRTEDIPILVQHILETARFNRLTDQTAPGIEGAHTDRTDQHVEPAIKVRHATRPALERLKQHRWPGNVRELVNAVERAVSLASDDTLALGDLPPYLGTQAPTTLSPPAPDTDQEFKEAKEAWVASFERDYIEEMLSRHDGNISQAAREAGIDRKYFRKLMKKHGLVT